MQALTDFLGNTGLRWSHLAVLLAILGGWTLASWTVSRTLRGKRGRRLGRQLVQLGLGALALFLLLLLMPLPKEVRPELINLVGIVLSATIALSSTTFLSNAMAGVMLRAVRNFKTGDLIYCGDHKGRVSERGLLHVEIQTEDSDLVTMPNLFLVTHPLRVTNETSTLISAEVSLGYDVPRQHIEKLLIAAANEVGLKKPFVWILELGDFSVLYRVAGLLQPADRVLSTRSRLCGAMLDHLHRGGVEIVSPTFMNQRRISQEERVIPPAASVTAVASDDEPPEELVFGKAKQAASLEKQQEELDKLDKEIEELESKLASLSEGSERNGTAARIERRKLQRERLSAVLERSRLDAGQEAD